MIMPFSPDIFISWSMLWYFHVFLCVTLNNVTLASEVFAVAASKEFPCISETQSAFNSL